MWLLITSCIGFLISNLCLATINNDPKNIFYQNKQIQQCNNLGDTCQDNSDCCSDLICYSNQEDDKRCLLAPSHHHHLARRNKEDFVIPPYYNPLNQLYPYGISQPALPFYKAQELKQTHESKKMEWDHCQFHEECEEGHCCYVHFRFRSVPKWFCRPNRNDISELCEPLTKYHSLKDIPAWKQQQQQQQRQQEVDDEQETTMDTV
ncbi:unnamed protein product [Adineta steineri]|uniref:Uncharacterized protein n=1 Tax=Adineta steineri TaxID=433720 RepID=A0A815FXI4_9BILA|nr:unnamed protein product [Adineta steineri]CAF3711049.1 unnamed protein product [Adineta steineri]